VWHRIFVSLGLSPEWPFGNVSKIYDCTHYIPEGLVNGPEDRNGHCIMWTYAVAHHIPDDVVPTMIYGRRYDVALREAFFHIFSLYPKQMLETFFYIKPRYIVRSIAQSVHLRFRNVQPALLGLFVAALGNILLFGATSPASSLRSKTALAGAAILLAASTIPPFIAVWAMPHTSGDLLLYCLFLVGLGGLTVIGSVGARLLGPGVSGRPSDGIDLPIDKTSV
jgi:hypothetical protein